MNAGMGFSGAAAAYALANVTQVVLLLILIVSQMASPLLLYLCSTWLACSQEVSQVWEY